MSPQLEPSQIAVDFEDAYIHEFHRVFNEKTIKGCFFFTHVNWGKKKQIGLAPFYRADKNTQDSQNKRFLHVFVPTPGSGEDFCHQLLGSFRFFSPVQSPIPRIIKKCFE